jgi:hypothetical protein
MRGVPVSFSPLLLSHEQRLQCHNTFRADEALEGSEPMVVVVGAVIGLTTPARSGKLGSQRRRPFAPREDAGFRQLDGKREGMGLPRLGEDRPALVARQ